MTIKHCHELKSWSRPETEPSDVGLVACMHRCPVYAPAQSRSISCSTRIDKRITRPTGKPCRWRRNRTLLEPRGIKRDTRVSSARGSGLPLLANLVSIPKGARTRRFGRTIANCIHCRSQVAKEQVMPILLTAMLTPSVPNRYIERSDHMPLC